MVNFRVIWVPERKVFSIKFQIMDKGSPAFWEVLPDAFLKMIERAELQLQAFDGQNRLNRDYYHFEFVDKLGNDVEINLEHCDKDVFVQLTAYVRKVYDSWMEHCNDK